MSDDGWWGGGDLFLGLLLGALLMGDRQRAPQTGHHHGEYWHSHDIPPGLHVHDAHPDGPIRVVPPTPEELAAQAQRRAETQDGWAIILGALGILALFAGWGRTSLVLVGVAMLVSSSVRAELRNTITEVREGWTRARNDRRRDADGAADSPVVAQPFVASGVDVGPDGVGRLHVRLHGWCQITTSAIEVEVTVWRGGGRDELLAVQLHNLIAGEARQVVLTGQVPYLGHDRIEVNSREAAR
jgi:hypothetical protein